MLLGKRARPPIMKRTTSMTEITFDVSLSSDDEMVAAGSQPSDPHNPFSPSQYQYQYQACLDQRYSGMVSSRTSHRRNSADFVLDSSTHFLRSCGLCKRRLVPTRDIYMYRGDTAFCSLECRQQQMNQDERLEKCSLASKKEVVTSSASAARSQVAAKGETVAAV